MASCSKCGGEAFGRRICISCLGDWSKMRAQAFEYVQGIHGKMSPDNLKVLQKEMKRLDKLWKKDPDKFYEEVGPKEKEEA